MDNDAPATPPDLTPRGIGRILDRAFDVYRANFRTIVTASAIFIFPLALAAGVAQVFYMRGILPVARDIFTDPALGPDLGALAQLQLWGYLANAVSLPYWVARVFIASCLFASAGSMLYGQRPTVREFLRSGTSRFLPFLGASALIALLSGFYFLVVPLVLLAGWALAPMTIVTEAAPFDRAFGRSWSLTLGSKWRVVGFYLVVSAFVLVLESAVTSPTLVRQIVASIQSPDAVFQPLSVGWKTVEGLFTAAAATVALPFMELAWFSLYLDLRARREGLDLVVRAEQERP